MRGGNVFLFGGALIGGFLLLQWLRTGAQAAAAIDKAVEQQLADQPYHNIPAAPSGYTVSPADPSNFVEAHPAVVGAALGYGSRYMGDPYFHE